jgi:hypothetical protein
MEAASLRKTHRVAYCKLQRRQLKSGVHGGSTLRQNSRWRRIFAKVEFVVFVSNIMYELGYIRTWSCIRCE